MRHRIEGEFPYPARRFQAHVAEIESEGDKTLL